MANAIQSGRVVVVVPTLNEAENVSALIEAMPANVGAWALDILFVDDDSSDGTREIIAPLCGGGRVHLLHRIGKRGLGGAYIEGFRWALARCYDLVFEMDADFSHDPRYIADFISKIESGADLVLGSRYIGGVRVLNWPISRLLLSISAGRFVRAVTGMPFSDPTGGFKCFRRTTLERLNLDTVRSNGYGFQIELTHQAWMIGCDIREIPIVFEDRRAGVSKMSIAIAGEAFARVLHLGVLSILKDMSGRKK